MKVYKEVIIPAQPQKIESQLVKTLCDRCNINITWESAGYTRSEVEVSWEAGSYYPEGADYERLSVDICSNCFMNLLVPFLEKEGFDIEIEEKSW